MARLTERGLRRSVGVPGLFATAYGNVGSSIYYALGLVAAHALGLTPLVFMFAGGLFVLTAKTYAEGASMFPEAGGSSSFARHAFDDVVPFFAGWALSLDYIFALSVAMVAYTGIETVSNMAEEAKDPGHDVPRSVNLVLVAVLGVYAGISVVALSALPVIHHAAGYSPALSESFHHAGYATALGGHFENDPVLGIVERLGLHGVLLSVAKAYVGVLAATILLIATNAGLIGISRLSWSLAEHRQLPTLFSQLHPSFRTPWFTIVFFSLLAGLLILPGETTLMGNLYSFV